MGKFDKDRFQKELAVKHCLAKGEIPFVEVIVPSTSDLSDSTEVLTDIDVLGIGQISDGSIQRTIFDCKTSTRLSAINRAFWAAGLKEFTNCDEAYVILKSSAVNNHRLSALSINVDLHDENSFIDLSKTYDLSFPSEIFYQSSMDRWESLSECYAKNQWAKNLFDLAKNNMPLSQSPWSVFRKLLAEIRNVRGEFDPKKAIHAAIYLDILASAFVLWAKMARDIRRFYDPSVNMSDFEKILKYYFWGGKDSYIIRQQLSQTVASGQKHSIELPAWKELFSFVGIIVSAPLNMLSCAHICRELSLRFATQDDEHLDANITTLIKRNARVRQFSMLLSDYICTAGSLPIEFGKNIGTEFQKY